VRVDGVDAWPLDRRAVLEAMLRDAVAEGGIPTGWQLEPV